MIVDSASSFLKSNQVVDNLSDRVVLTKCKALNDPSHFSEDDGYCASERSASKRNTVPDRKENNKEIALKVRERELKVVIIDDEDILLRLYTAVLAKAGCSVLKTFTDGKQAVSYFANNSVTWPDIALIDYRMPTLNGVETAKALKSLNPKIQTVLVSAFELAPDAISYFDRAIQKPFSISQLLEIIRSLSRQSQIQSQRLGNTEGGIKWNNEEN